MWLERFGEIDVLVFYIFCAVSAVIVIIGLISVLLPCCLPSIKGVSPGSTIDFYIIIGGRLIVTSVLIQGVHVAWASTSALTALCQLYPAVLLIGLTMFLGGLFVKSASIYGYRWYKRPSTIPDEWKPNLAMWGVLILSGIAAVIWCVLFTPTLAEITSERYICFNSEAGFEWKVATSSWHGLLLLLGFIMMPLQCRAARNTPCRSESNALGVSIMNTLFSVIAGICVYFLYEGSPTVMYAIIGGLELWMVLLCDIAMLAGKAHLAKRHTKMAEEFEEDERYDVIKEDAISNEAMEMTNTPPNQFVNQGYEEDGPETFNY